MAERDELGDITDQGPWEREDEETAPESPPEDELPPVDDAA
jgi:hypothetical protein